MELGMVGLGRMGANMAERIRRHGHTVVGYDRDPALSDVADLDGLVARLRPPRAVWVMVPAGVPTRETVTALAGLLAPGDVVVDGGNSHFRDDQAHAAALGEHGIGFLDVGVSGGVWGLREGYALMVGGEEEHVRRLWPIFDALRPESERLTGPPAPAPPVVQDGAHGRPTGGGTDGGTDGGGGTGGTRGGVGSGAAGVVHAGPTGAGHFAKMVHNGIEYGIMQAFAEGYELLAASDVVTDVPGTFRSWRQGTVIRSWLLDLLVRALDEDPDLHAIRGVAQDSGEGRWTVQTAVEHAVPVPVISAALFARFASRQDDSPAMKVVAALRNQFGGHAVTAMAGEAAKGADAPGADVAPPPVREER